MNELVSPSDELLDPSDLEQGQQPALVERPEGEVYAADVALDASGWLYVREWSGDACMFPPQQVGRVRFVPTEWIEGELRRRVADEQLLETALPDDQDGDGEEWNPQPATLRDSETTDVMGRAGRNAAQLSMEDSA